MIGRKILVITYGEYSGTNSSIVGALRKTGCEVLEVRHRLWDIPFWPVYAMGMLVSAIRYYGIGFRSLFHYTPYANVLHARLNQILVERNMPVDAVISTACIFQNHQSKRVGEVRYALLTDHVNLLSKQLPDFGYRVREKNKHCVWNDVEQNVLCSQDHNFVLAAYVKRAMIEDYNVMPENITVIGAGPNLDLDAERDGINKDFTQQNILFAGYEPERKGLPILISAFESISERYPMARLHIAGVTGVSTENILYYGRLQRYELRELYYHSQIFVLPFLREPFGIVLVEAMWSKMACIGSNLGASPEIIQDGSSGYLIEPGSEKDLINKLNKLLSASDLVELMAENGYQIAKSTFSWNIAARRILNALFPDDLGQQRAI